MSEAESYVTNTDPSDEDWLLYNQDLFAALRGTEPAGAPQFAPLVDVDRRAAIAGVSLQEYFNQINEMVGPLGEAGLELVRSEMDGAWHITLVLKDES